MKRQLRKKNVLSQFFFSFRNLEIPHFIFLIPDFDFITGVALCFVAASNFPSHCPVASVIALPCWIHCRIVISSCRPGELLCIRVAPTALIPLSCSPRIDPTGRLTLVHCFLKLSSRRSLFSGCTLISPSCCLTAVSLLVTVLHVAYTACLRVLLCIVAFRLLIYYQLQKKR